MPVESDGDGLGDHMKWKKWEKKKIGDAYECGDSNENENDA